MEKLFPRLFYIFNTPLVFSRKNLLFNCVVTACHLDFQLLIVRALSGKPDNVLYGFPDKGLSCRDWVKEIYIFTRLSCMNIFGGLISKQDL